MGTLTGGVAIHDSLAETARALKVAAATFEMLGGITEVELTEYDFINKVRKPPIIFSRPMEILAGHGTISWLDDQPYVHTHLVLSFRHESAPNGIVVVGGHAARALAFAVEFTLTVYNGEPVRRKLQAETGLALWDLPSFAG